MVFGVVLFTEDAIWFTLKETMQTNLVKKAAWEFLDKQPHGTLITLDSEKTPEAAAVFFFIEPNFTSFFVTKIGTRKYKNIAERQVATLFVYSESELLSVEMKGTVAVSMDTKEILNTITKFQSIGQNHGADYWVPPIAQIEKGDYVVCKFFPNVVTYNNFSQNQTDPAFVRQTSFNPNAI